MTRVGRGTFPDSVQHVISRFVNDEFRICGACERLEYLRRFARALPHCDWTALAYALMSSHTHLCLYAGNDPSSALMQPLNSGFARYLNRTQGRTGPVFAGRHKTVRFEGETIARLLAYIHNNPVRARVVGDPADSDWTSHRAYIGDVKAPPFINVELGLALAGFSSTPSGRLAFHDFVRSLSSEGRDDAMSGRTMEEDRARTREVAGAPVEVRAPEVYVGSGGRTRRVEVVMRPFTPVRPRWPGHPLEVLGEVASVTGVGVEALQGRGRRGEVVRGRRLALYAWTRHLNRRLGEMAGLLGISDPAASYLVRTRIDRGIETAARDLAARLWGHDRERAGK